MPALILFGDGSVFPHVIWMGCLRQGFLAGIYWLTIQANRQTQPHLPFLFLPLLLGFLLATPVWAISLLRPFL